MGPAAAALRSPRRAVPSKREGERKLNCMPYPKNRRLSPSGVPHAPIHGRTSTALALSVLVCISLLNQPHNGLVPRVSAGYIPAGDRPQHRRQRRGCGVSASVCKTSAPNADQSRSRQGGIFALLSRTRTPPDFSACAELAAKLANCRCVMLLAKLQSWRPGDGLREAGQLSKKMKNNLREK